MNYLVTGAGGFVGQHLIASLIDKDVNVTGLTRTALRPIPCRSVAIDLGASDMSGDLNAVLAGQKVVIHLANRAHVMGGPTEYTLDRYREVNVTATLNLARQAIIAGVERFIYLSSIKVNGESTGQSPFCPDDPLHPRDPYAISKFEAELGLEEICRSAAMELVVIRPPLVYGPGVKGNLARLVRWIDSGRPLPFGALQNSRDMIGLNNLVDLVIMCAEHPKAAGQVFLCSDNHPLSTPELIRFIAAARQSPDRLWKLSPRILEAIMAVIGKQDAYARLAGDLSIDMRHTQEVLGWMPPHSVKASMQWAFGGRGESRNANS